MTPLGADIIACLFSYCMQQMCKRRGEIFVVVLGRKESSDEN